MVDVVQVMFVLIWVVWLFLVGHMPALVSLVAFLIWFLALFVPYQLNTYTGCVLVIFIGRSLLTEFEFKYVLSAVCMRCLCIEMACYVVF